MSATRSEFPSTEGVLLLRQDGKTMAIHLTAVIAILEAIIFEPDILSDTSRYSMPVMDHYAVEATGRADRLFMWTGPDPFAKPQVESARAEVEA